MNPETKTFEFGITLLHLTGITAWNVSAKWKKCLSYFYMVHIPLGFIYFSTINLILVIQSSSDTRRMLEFIWRGSGVFTLFAQVTLISLHGKKLRNLFTLPEGVNTSNMTATNIKKRYNFKLYCYIGGITIFMIAYLIRKYFFKGLLHNDGNGDVENFIPNMISNQLIANIIHVHTSIFLLQNFVVLLGHDFLFIYSVALIEICLDHLQQALQLIDLEEYEMFPVRRLYCGTGKYSLNYCVKFHQHVIKMTQTVNAVFSTSILLLVWRSFAMSIAAYELTKRVDNWWIFMEILMFLVISLIQMFTLCLEAHNCRDQGVRLVHVCMDSAWRDVITTKDARMRGNRRSLLVIASRCAMPLEFNAGPFYRLSKDTFGAVASLFVSYYLFFFSLKLVTDN